MQVGWVLEDPVSGFCGEVVAASRDALELADRHGRRRGFPLPSCWDHEGTLVTVVRARGAVAGTVTQTRSGSLTNPVPQRARVARGSRIWVEGRHDAELVERVWGEDLRAEGVVVELLDGIDNLAAGLASFAPSATRRLGVLVDHLTPGSKESRLVAEVRQPYVHICGHPYVDIWQAVRPAVLGLAAWPVIPPGQPWKDGIVAAVGGRLQATSPPEFWRRLLARVTGWTDLEPGLLRAVEELVDFVSVEPQ